jgi:hypothetical protein
MSFTPFNSPLKVYHDGVEAVTVAIFDAENV